MEHISRNTFRRTLHGTHFMEHLSWNTFCGKLHGTHFTEHILWNTSQNTFHGTHFTEHFMEHISRNTLWNIFCGTHFVEHFVEQILWNTLQNTMTKFRCFFPKPSHRSHRCLFRHQLCSSNVDYLGNNRNVTDHFKPVRTFPLSPPLLTLTMTVNSIIDIMMITMLKQ